MFNRFIIKKTMILFKIVITAIAIGIGYLLVASLTTEDYSTKRLYMKKTELLQFHSDKTGKKLDESDIETKIKLGRNIKGDLKNSGIYITEDNEKTTIDVSNELEKLNTGNVPADEPRLVKLIRHHFIARPSDLPYNLSEFDRIDTSGGQAPFVDSRLGFKESGFFIESGAHDGEYLSNTLYLERIRGWTGILIEPLPAIYQDLKHRNRKAYSLNACLSPKPHPSKEYMSSEPVLARILDKRIRQVVNSNQNVQVQCFPLYSVLLALNKTTIDFLSLDVEGVEQGVLDTIPWDKVNINMIAVEYDKWPGGEGALRKYMELRNYKCLVRISGHGSADLIFKKKNLY